MNMKEYILNEIKGITLNSSIKTAKKICKGFPITHIPIIDDIAILSLSRFDIAVHIP